MMDEKKEMPLAAEQPNPSETYPMVENSGFPTEKRELIFGLFSLVGGLMLSNCMLYWGLNLGFALAAVFSIVCASIYLLVSGRKPTFYSGALLVLSLFIALGFGRSNDGFVKFIMVQFLFLSVNLGLCLTARQNRREAGSFGSIWDAFGTFFGKGLGKMSLSAQGLKHAFRCSGSAGQKGSAFLLGLVICIPVLAVVIPLLIGADAAFSGLMDLLPKFEFGEFLTTVTVGGFAAFWLYTRGTALVYDENKSPCAKPKKGMSAITVNTVFCGVAVVYVAYLVSQMAYFFGGFAGILPEGFSTAEYARRGFFEMAVLSGFNLGLIALGLRLIKTEKKPIFTKVLCLFIGLMTLLLIATASAKMFLYIESYGLTSLRVLTQIIMLFLAVTTVVALVWMFAPRLPYMKAVLLAALVIGTATLWMDVDTVVANYNVDAYLSGKLETVDISYLYYDIGPEAVDAIDRLATEAKDPSIQRSARGFAKQLRERYAYSENASHDLRQWNFVIHQARSAPKS